MNYKTFDLMNQWREMEPVPDQVNIHGVPAETLNEMGWRYDDGRLFIPYFNATKDKIPFAQWRHPKGDTRRFTFLKDAKPIAYGGWNLDNPIVFLVEGCSDAAVLEYCGVPYVAMPSASSGAILERLAGFCIENGISIVYAGDRDTAGSKLLEKLDGLMPYRVKQVPPPYKDWGEYLENTDLDTVRDYAFVELGYDVMTDELHHVRSVWPDAVPLPI